MAGKSSSLAHKQPIYAVGAVAYRLNARGQIQILLIKKRGGYWTLPKGQVRPSEDDASALLRELYEETGLTGIIEENVAQIQYITPRRRRPHRKIVTYYVVRVAPDAVAAPRRHTSEGIEKVRWSDLREALQRVKRKRISDVVACACALLHRRTRQSATGIP